MRRLFFIVAVLLAVRGYGQTPSAANFGKQWALGAGMSFTVNFGNHPPTTQFLDTMYSPYFYHGHSNICDSMGNLLLCSDGMNLYNASCDTIEEGARLVDSVDYAANYGWSAQAQASIILPFQHGKYYLVNGYFSDSLYLAGGDHSVDRLAYHVVDMGANGGAGKVVRRKVQMVSPGTKLSRVQMTACRHANGRDWWLVKQGFDSNVVYKFLFQQDTVLGPFVQRFPAPMFTWVSYGGQSAFSQDGTRYATTCRGAKKVFVADFDRCSGTLSNPLIYDVPVASTHNPGDPTEVEQFSESCQFSPNGRFLYVGQYYNVQQLDLQDNNPTTRWARVAGLDTTWAEFMSYSSIYTGPDGKLYVGNWNGLSGQMSYFATPDVKGAGCGFTPRGLRFPALASNQGIAYGASDPPNMPNYALGATNPPCEFLGVRDAVAPVAADMIIYPNPGTGLFKVTLTGGNPMEGTLEVSNLMGQEVATISLKGNTAELSLKGQPAGLYFYRWVLSGKTVQSGKIVLNP